MQRVCIQNMHSQIRTPLPTSQHNSNRILLSRVCAQSMHNEYACTSAHMRVCTHEYAHVSIHLRFLRGVDPSSGEKGTRAERTRAGLPPGACRICEQCADTSMHECVSRSLQIRSAALRVALMPRLALATVALPAPGSTVASGWSCRPCTCSVSETGRRRFLAASSTGLP